MSICKEGVPETPPEAGRDRGSSVALEGSDQAISAAWVWSHSPTSRLCKRKGKRGDSNKFVVFQGKDKGKE